MSTTTYKVLTQACQSHGAASYLFENELKQLERAGLIERVSEHRFRATEEGRRVWLLD